MNFQLSSWAIRRPVPTIVLFLILTLCGWLAFKILPIQASPQVSFPVVSISIAQAGAAPSELELDVARPIEDVLAALPGLKRISSTLSDGLYQGSVEFQLDVNPDRAVNDVRDAIAKVRAELPGSIQEPQISRVDVEDEALSYYAVAGDGQSASDLSWFVDNTVRRALLAVPGVEQVERMGGVRREIRVELKPERLLALGISAAEINTQLRHLNVNLPSGRAQLHGQEQAIRTLGGQPDLQALAALPISLGNQRWARLSELADVQDGHEEIRQQARLNQQPVVGFAIYRAKSASDTVVDEHVRQALAQLQEREPHIKVTPILTLVDYTYDSFKTSMTALLEGAVLTVLVVLIFLRNRRATLVAALALPLSILPTFAVMALLGYTLNSITLLALTLVIGILVDDAIVEIENIERHLAMGKRPFQAAIDAADAIGPAVIAITAAIVAVFLPVSFIGGYIGQYFEQFGVTVSAAVLASLLVARLATPLLAAYLLQPADASHCERQGPWMSRYLTLLSLALRHRRLTLLCGVGVLALSLLLVPLLPSGFLPASDVGISHLNVTLPPGSTLQQTDQRLQDLSRIIQEHEDVSAVFATAGGTDSSGAQDVSRGRLLIRLKPYKQRNHSQNEVEQQLHDKLAGFSDLRYFFRGRGEERDLSITLLGTNPQQLSHTAHELAAQMRTLPGLAGVHVNEPLLRPELRVQINAEQAALSGVTSTQIGTALRVATIGETDTESARFSLPDRQVPIRVLIQPAMREDLDTLRLLRIPNGTADHAIGLLTVADLHMGAGPARIDRLDRQQRISVGADLLPGHTLGQALEKIDALPALQSLPAGISRSDTGDVEMMQEMFDKFGLAMGFGVLMVYAVLVLLFRDFLQPITILVALPLSIVGAIGGLLLYQAALDLASIIGILMLMGIVTKNSILLVEFAGRKREQGMDLSSALMQAGRERARPIIMTTLAMVAGMMPTLFLSGADAGFRSPMAAAVIGGLISSTVLSLIFVPVVYSYMDQLWRWLGRRLSRLSSVTDQDRQLAEARASGRQD
ncbi:MAG TPA: efflux RND transporter permease subunit [Alcaligenes sp.]|nr:efflux RND transporter permease subunit [Alcaligenes sp.]HRL27772.1 efflux RND transporter permease subunit [Alcaligenes sp.]